MSLTRPNMKPKASFKASALHETDSYRDREEYSDGCLSQDEESERYGKSSTSYKNSEPAPKTSSKNKGTKNIPQPSRKSAQRQIPIGLSVKNVTDQEVMTDPVCFNPGGVFTRAFVIQLVILIGIILVYTVFLTYHIRDMQVRHLRENMNNILHVSESGQRYVDKTINDKISIRIPVLLSNGTPTVIDDEVEGWVDSYFREKVPHSIKAHMQQQQHRHMVEQSCDNKVKEFVDEKITPAFVNEKVIDKLIPNIDESIEKNSPQLIEKQMEILLADSIIEKLQSYTDDLIKLESNGTFESIIKKQNVKSLFNETLNAIISEYVKVNSPGMIDKYTSSEAAIEDMNNKLTGMIDERLKDAPMVVDEALMAEKLLHQINMKAERLLKQEISDQIDSTVKRDVEKVVSHHGNEVEKFQRELGKKRDELTEKISEAERLIEDLKKSLGELKQPQAEYLSRQDRQGNLIVMLTLLVVILMFCVYWIYCKQNTNRPLNQHVAVPHQENVRSSDTCIILFNHRLTDEIRKLVTDLKIPDFDFDFYVIKSHEDAARMPRHKVYLMCCEFTERHVIIEEQGIGLGDLHRKTHDKVMEISGKLIILYIHDPGSRQLKNEYYSQGIYCVSSQPELMKLRDHGCFFSMHKQLDDFQVKRLRKKLNEYIK